MEEVELIESLKTLQTAEETRLDTATSSSCSPANPADVNRPAWALDLAKSPFLIDKFEQLEVAVTEYNAAASQQKRDIVAKHGCELKDVLLQANALQEAFNVKEENRSLGSNIQAGLQQFCKSTLHYAAVMDALAQHHPEWVSLAWGTMKLLLMIPIEYQKVKEGIVANLGRIGSKLELVSLLLSFYSFERMTGAASAIYASIADFLGFCVRYLRSNCLVKTLKTIVTPFDTRLGPILKTIDENYAILRLEAEVQFMIYQFERQCSLQRDMVEVKEDHGRIIGVLEEIIRRDDISRKRRVQAIDASQSLDQTLLKPPRLEICEDFFQDLLPLDCDLHQIDLEMDMLPMSELSESVNVLRLPSFQTWLSSKVSGLLWVDGYGIPRRPSWTTDLSLKIVRAATESSYDTLSYFGSLRRGRVDDAPKPRALVQSLLFSMLQKFPAVTSHGDPELFNAEIFVAAKTDLDLSWRIFVECLRVLPSSIIYIVIEGVDHVNMIGDEKGDFESLLGRLSNISTELLNEKVVKVALTSVRPNAGYQHLFPSLDGLEVTYEHNLLIRVPAAAARRRKTRSKLQKRKSPTLHSPGLMMNKAPTDMASDFAPSDSGGDGDGTISDSSSDFDIFGKRKGTAGRAGAPRYSWSGPASGSNRSEIVQLDDTETMLRSTTKEIADDSDSSFDIFETHTELPKETQASGEDLSDFAP
ncbi:hypothetical protein CORC01_05690 [Colletotrichum orchidophilum]|uniref:DUF7708 domain-containing protein n=1 Tax=Colletotrichum orchidophilum TaxID=1209926 RepID=A0A1G4BC54_9PEZI|nr:uncharacterized protein CORC01_05690 [Colletotrichum orchidophilum]OHE99000.1 hypothetical protein CORC01_05690 [Colletotrichum orchidophilum]